LHLGRRRWSPRFGRRCRSILSHLALDNHRTSSDANASEKLSGKSHRLPNSIVYGTASRVKPRRVKLGCDRRRRCCSAVVPPWKPPVRAHAKKVMGHAAQCSDLRSQKS
jgi:hypothetical protein